MGANNIVEISLDSLGVYFGMQDSSYFRGTLPTTIYTAYYNNSCSVSTTKDDLIVISPNTSNNSSSSYSYSFMLAMLLEPRWAALAECGQSPWGSLG